MSNASSSTTRPKSNTFAEYLEQKLVEAQREKELVCNQNQDLKLANATLESENADLAKTTARLESEKRSLLKARGGKRSQHHNNRRHDSRTSPHDESKSTQGRNSMTSGRSNNKSRAWKPTTQIKVNKSHASVVHDRRKFRGTHRDDNNDDSMNNDPMPLVSSTDTFPSLEPSNDTYWSYKSSVATKSSWDKKIKLPIDDNVKKPTTTLSSLQRAAKSSAMYSKKSRKLDNSSDQQGKVDTPALTSDKNAQCSNPSSLKASKDSDETAAPSTLSSLQRAAKGSAMYSKKSRKFDNSSDQQEKVDTSALTSDEPAQSTNTLTASMDSVSVSNVRPSSQEEIETIEKQQDNDTHVETPEKANPTLIPSKETTKVSSPPVDSKAENREQPSKAPPVFRFHQDALPFNPSTDTELSTNPSFETCYSQQQPTVVRVFVPIVYDQGRNSWYQVPPPPYGYQQQYTQGPYPYPFPQYMQQQPPPPDYYNGYNEFQQPHVGGGVQPPVPDNPWSQDGVAAQNGPPGYGQGDGSGYMPFSGEQWNYQPQY